jgi:N-acetylmuramoyl-L-alanine amidase
MLKSIYYRLITAVFVALLFPFVCGANEKFILVIDPGHGGRDVGAVGRVAQEKTINLRVALAFGNLVEKNCKDVKVIYTRKTDKFVTLHERAAIANRNHADLFISIHTNAVAKGRKVLGTETYTLGMARADENLEVAKRENSVITFEDNYQQSYAGFDPNSPESYIIFEFMQDKFMKQSVDLARFIQQQYTSYARRQDKGVKQAGFLVLRETSMPSVLTELGFISTPSEEKYLNSKAGVEQLAQSLYRGFQKYYKQQQSLLDHGAVVATPRPVAEEPEPLVEPEEPVKPVTKVQPTVQNVSKEAPIFKVQIFTSATKVKSVDKRIKGMKNVDYYKEGGVYKYTCGSSKNYQEMNKLRKQLNAKFKGCFVVAFQGGKRVDLNQARKIAGQ